jgi:thiol-disulfide isomerase/thioredoxin
MRSNIILLIIFIVGVSFTSCKVKLENSNDIIEIINEFAEVKKIMEQHKDKVLVLNFWATTCPPCIKEMPHFNQLEAEKEGNDVKIMLISLDRPQDLDKRVVPFVKKHKLIPEVALLADDNYSAWTDKIDPSWYGALPATLIIKGDKKKFKFGMYESYQELKADVIVIK